MIGGAGKIQDRQENEQWSNSRRWAVANVKYWQWKAATRRNGQGGERGRKRKGSGADVLGVSSPQVTSKPFLPYCERWAFWREQNLSKLGVCGVTRCSGGCQTWTVQQKETQKPEIPRNTGFLSSTIPTFSTVPHSHFWLLTATFSTAPFTCSDTV